MEGMASLPQGVIPYSLGRGHLWKPTLSLSYDIVSTRTTDDASGIIALPASKYSQCPEKVDG